MYIEGRGQGHRLNQQRQHQQLHQGSGQAADTFEEVLNRQPAFPFPRLEGDARPQLEGDAGEALAQLPQGVISGARRRVVNQRAPFAEPLQHHEVIEVPVEYAGQPQLIQILHIQPHRARREFQGVRLIDDGLQVGAVGRTAESFPQGEHRTFVAVAGGDHG